MKKNILQKLMMLLSLITLLLLLAFSKKNEAVLIKATLFTHTNDDDKDHDTGVYVEIKTADAQSLILHANNRDNSGDDGTQYKDGSDHQFDLDIDAPGMEKSLCAGYKVKI